MNEGLDALVDMLHADGTIRITRRRRFRDTFQDKIWHVWKKLRSATTGRTSVPPYFRMVEALAPPCWGKTTLIRHAAGFLRGDWRLRSQHTVPQHLKRFSLSTGSFHAALAYYESLDNVDADRLEGLRRRAAQNWAMLNSVADEDVAFLIDQGVCRSFA